MKAQFAFELESIQDNKQSTQIVAVECMNALDSLEFTNPKDNCKTINDYINIL